MRSCQEYILFSSLFSITVDNKIELLQHSIKSNRTNEIINYTKYNVYIYFIEYIHIKKRVYLHFSFNNEFLMFGNFKCT